MTNMAAANEIRTGIKTVLPDAEDKRLRNNDPGMSLEIDTNFRLFIETRCVPCEKAASGFALKWALLKKPYNKTEHKGTEPVTATGIEAAVKNIVRIAGNYLSTDGQMRTYASITLKTMTGIGPLTP